jgi:hypothetical protein
MVTEITLPVEGELDWDDKIAAAFYAIRDAADTALATAQANAATDAGVASLVTGTGPTHDAVVAIASQFVQGDNSAAASWFSGTGVPSNGTGIDGDYYLRDTGQVYRKGSGVWADTTISLKGATGAAGANGTNGTNGATGPAGPPTGGIEYNWNGTAFVGPSTSPDPTAPPVGTKTRHFYGPSQYVGASLPGILDTYDYAPLP